MGFASGAAPGGGATSPAATIAALIAPIEDPTLRGYFTGFADLHLSAA
jgi:hypothetical protein